MFIRGSRGVNGLVHLLDAGRAAFGVRSYAVKVRSPNRERTPMDKENTPSPFRRRADDYRSNSRDGSFGYRNNNYQGSQRGRGNYNGGSRKGPARRNSKNWRDNGADSDEYVTGRTALRLNADDGLMGEPDYELNRDFADLKWTDLIPESAAAESASAGVSQVPTSALAAHRLLSLPLVNSLVHNRKYEFLTPVQAQTILPILRNESCVVRAKTGTGKTAAFSVPAIQKVLDAKRENRAAGKVKALIITPTRELAQQIADEIYKITKFGGGLNQIKVQSLVGGLSKFHQMKSAGLLETSRDTQVADIIVATPGRMNDILQEPGVPKRFNELQFRVFDEADRILDIGFEREVESIRRIIDEHVEPGHETPLLLFSATADRTMRDFARSQFGDRVRIIDTVPKNEPTANELVDQVAVACTSWADVYEGAAQAIFNAASDAQAGDKNFKAVVFLPTTTMVDHFERLVKDTIPRSFSIRSKVFAIHGQRTQAGRQRGADEFRTGREGILITTDVVARGMDFPQVSHVFQLGSPPDVSSYVHRIGRTARIGNSGKSLLFYTNHVRGYIDALAREGIRPKLEVFQADEEFHQRFLGLFAHSVPRDEMARELTHSLLSYMTVLKSKYRVDEAQFMRDMLPFVELMGLDQVPLTAAQRQTWTPRFQQKKRPSSSRRRMRW